MILWVVVIGLCPAWLAVARAFTVGGWIGRVDAICLEPHDRFKPGRRAFYQAVEDFRIEFRRGEDILVLRGESRLTPASGTPPE